MILMHDQQNPLTTSERENMSIDISLFLKLDVTRVDLAGETVGAGRELGPCLHTNHTLFRSEALLLRSFSICHSLTMSLTH